MQPNIKRGIVTIYIEDGFKRARLLLKKKTSYNLDLVEWLEVYDGREIEIRIKTIESVKEK